MSKICLKVEVDVIKTKTCTVYFFKYSLNSIADPPRSELDKAIKYSIVKFQFESTILHVLTAFEETNKQEKKQNT